MLEWVGPGKGEKRRWSIRRTARKLAGLAGRREAGGGRDQITGGVVGM